MEKIKKWLKLPLFTAVLAGIFMIFFTGQPAQAATGINSQISFQGKLVNTNGTNIADGTYNMQFKIYQDGNSSGSGTLKWTESRLVSNSQGVTVTAGTFQVNLGAVNALTGVDFNQDTLWLSINVGGTTSTATPTYDGEMTPMIRLTSVPYALNAGAVGGLTASQLVQLTPSAQQSGTINVSGNIQTGGTLQATTIDAAASGALTVGSTNATGVTLAKNTTITSGQTLTVGGQQVFSGAGILQAAAISSSVAYSNLTQVGTITTGTWNASTLAAAYGGTGQSTYTVGDLLYASSATALSKLNDVATGSCLISGGTGVAPTWGSCGSSSGANTTLSNLGTTAINASLLVGATTNTIDIGSSSATFRSGYFGTGLYTPLIRSASGANLSIDTGGASSLSLGGTNATSINVGPTGSQATTAATNVATSTGAAQTISIGGTGTSGGSNSGTTVTTQGGTAATKVDSTGLAVQTFTNSAVAFQVQNASGTDILTVDTTNNINYLANPGFGTGTSGWSYSGSGTACSITTTNTNTYIGLNAYDCTLASSGNSTITESSFGISPVAGTYTFSFYAKASTASTLASTATFNGGGGTCTLNSTAITTNGFQRYYCTVTTSATTTSISVSVTTTGTGNHVYFDAFQLQTGSSVTQYTVGAIQLRGVVTDPVSIVPGSNSTTAFQVQDITGTSNLFIADTLNNKLTVAGNTMTSSQFLFSAASTATLQSATGQNLALNSGTDGGTLTTNAGTFQRTTTGGSTFTFDLNDTGGTFFKLFNSGPGVANLWLYGGGIYTGSGQTLRIDNSGNLSNIGTISSTGAATLNGNVQIGSATANTNSYLLTLNNYSNGTTEPTVANGAMYYNSALGAFRCGVAGAWRNCAPGIQYSAVTGTNTTTITTSTAGTIYITPIYISGQMTVNSMRASVSTALSAAGDIGLYNSAGTLVLNGGSSSVTTTTGAKAVTPVQAAANRIIEPGQYYAAITTNSTSGAVNASSFAAAGTVNRAGTISGGGLVLPSTITLSSITNQATGPILSFNN